MSLRAALFIGPAHALRSPNHSPSPVCLQCAVMLAQRGPRAAAMNTMSEQRTSNRARRSRQTGTELRWRCGDPAHTWITRPRPLPGCTAPQSPPEAVIDSVYMGINIRKFRTDKFDSVTNENFDSCNSLCKRLGTSRLQELHESKFPFVSRIKFICLKLSIFLLMYPGSTTLCEPALV